LKQIAKKSLRFIIPILLTSLSLCTAGSSLPQKDIVTVCIKDTCIQAEVVSAFAEREKGLMFRESLAKDKGMLFILEEEGLYGFWMKNMRFALDIIWLDLNKKIIDIKENVQPCGASCEILNSDGKAKYVLEVNAGFSKRNKIKVGEVARF
jgi:uncharacterized membrane protein (UPF0127 family)